MIPQVANKVICGITYFEVISYQTKLRVKGGIFMSKETEQNKTEQNEDTKQKRKKCSTCGDVKPATKKYFYARRASSDGLAYSCKDCARQHAYKSFKKRKKKQKAKERYEQNREEHIERSKKNYHENKEERLKQQKEYREKNQEVFRNADKRRRERIKESGGPDYTREEVIERDSVEGVPLCQLCGIPIINEELQIDHIVPLSSGGQDTMDNVRVTCKPCNQTRPKDGRDLEDEGGKTDE